LDDPFRDLPLVVRGLLLLFLFFFLKKERLMEGIVAGEKERLMEGMVAGGRCVCVDDVEDCAAA